MFLGVEILGLLEPVGQATPDLFQVHFALALVSTGEF
jgi:hypothetical protein